MKLTDVCVNLLNSQFDPDRQAVIERAAASGVECMVLTATDLQSTAAALDLCVRDSAVRMQTTAGVHPHDAGKLGAGWLQQLRQLAQASQVCAIGETGLDYYRNFTPRPQQQEVFRQQIALAAELGKTLFVHDRESQGDVLRLLSQQNGLQQVLIHCFTGSREELLAYLEAGYYIGITGWIADHRRGGSLRRLVPEIPLQRLVIETDAPFLRPHNAPPDFHLQHQLPARFKRRNEPALLPWVLNAVAEARGEPPAAVARATTANAARLFGFPGTDRETDRGPDRGTDRGPDAN